MPYRQNFPIPPVIDPPRKCLCIEIPASPEWKAVIAGNLSELSRWFNWERTGDDSGARCAAVWKDVMLSIDWSDMSCCCDDSIPPQYRYTGDGVLQQSDDGGVTWDDAPLKDPRNNSPEFPPIPGDDGNDKKCAAASGAAVLVKEQVGNNLTDDMSRYTLQQLISDWVLTMINTSNPLEALLTVVANQIFALVISVVRPALTDDVYHLFACALYCTMADDGSFSAEEWDAARSRILTDIAGVAGIFLEHLVYMLGARGLTNLVRNAPDTSGDCSDCDCDACLCNFEAMTAYGTYLECIGDTVYVEALFTGSTYAVYMNYGGVDGGTYDVNVCRNVLGYNVYEGTVGSSSVNRNTCHTGSVVFGAYFSVCAAQHGWESATPFKISIQYESCDDCG